MDGFRSCRGCDGPTRYGHRFCDRCARRSAEDAPLVCDLAELEHERLEPNRGHWPVTLLTLAMIAIGIVLIATAIHPGASMVACP